MVENVLNEINAIQETHKFDAQEEWYQKFLADVQIIKQNDAFLMSNEALKVLLKTYSARPICYYMDDVLSAGTIQSFKLIESYISVIIQNHSSQQRPDLNYPDYD